MLLPEPRCCAPFGAFALSRVEGGSMRNHVFLIESPKDDAVRNHLLLKENALPQLPSVLDGKDCSDAAPSILDRNTASMQRRLTKVMTSSRSRGGVIEHTLIAL